jgi:hypothetical protein
VGIGKKQRTLFVRRIPPKGNLRKMVVGKNHPAKRGIKCEEVFVILGKGLSRMCCVLKGSRKFEQEPVAKMGNKIVKIDLGGQR